MKIFSTLYFSLIALAACTSNPGDKKYTAVLTLSPSAAVELGVSDGKAADPIPLDTILIKFASLESDKRSMAILALVNNSDNECEKYMKDSIIQSNTVASGLGISNLALTTAAGVSSPVRSANVLSGLAAFAGGTQKELSDRVLGGKQPSLLYKSVMGLREKKRSEIATLLQAGSAGEQLAVSELASYHALCGVTVGINGFEEAVSNQQETAGARGLLGAAEKLNMEPSELSSLLQAPE